MPCNTPQPSLMPTHEFTLVLKDESKLTDIKVDAIYKAGCDDGLISSEGGRMKIEFTRTANSLDDAVKAAIAQVESTGFEVKEVVYQEQKK